MDGLRPPLIAVTTSELRGRDGTVPTREGEPPHHEMALGLPYLRAIERAGGIPVVAPPLHGDGVEALLDRVDGLCLSGGPDLDPILYGQRNDASLGPTWRELDGPELALARAADRRGLPVLAICRGLQLLNVARGGTLHQHLPDAVGDRITHRQSASAEEPTHWVALSGTSRLSEILGCRRLKVNSFHHQGIDELGRGLTVTSRASDGTIESVEAVDRPFVLAVQWHAECLASQRRHARLFAAFVDAAADSAGSASDRLRAA